jgi:hypothetical protein
MVKFVLVFQQNELENPGGKVQAELVLLRFDDGIRWNLDGRGDASDG